MPFQADRLQVGSTGEYLDTVVVDTAAGLDSHREVVVVADPENPDAIGAVKQAMPSATDFGSVIRQAPGSVTPKKLKAIASGESVVVAPAAGNAIRLWWYSLCAKATNGAEVEVGLRFGAGQTDFFQASLSQYGGIFSHSFKAGENAYHQGGVDQPLIVNLDSAQTVYVNIDYEEVTP